MIQQMTLMKQEWFLDSLLDINYSILVKLTDAIKLPQPTKHCLLLIDDIYSGFDVCVKLIADNGQGNVQEKAS